MKIYFKPNASQVTHFPIQPTLPLTSKPQKMKAYFLQLPIHILIVALFLLLIFSKFIKILNQKPISALSLFKMLPTTQLPIRQFILVY